MKKLRILLFAALFMPATAVFSQGGPLTVTNNTGCDMLVNAWSMDFGGIFCPQYPTAFFCIPPGGVMVIPPPGPPTAVWSLLDAQAHAPTTGCTQCPSPINTSSNLGMCGPNPNVTPDGPCLCNGGNFVAQWTAANAVTLF